MTDTDDTAVQTAPARPAPTEPGADAPKRPNRKVRVGTVVSAKMDKTAIVTVIDRVRHDRYSKTIQRTLRLYVHDEENSASVGDRVRVMETRPLSKLKRWRIVEIVERAR